MDAIRFRYLEPRFCAGLLDDPLLLVRILPNGRSLLFDCGQLHHLAKRVLGSVDLIFISHAHMDHFMGLDQLIRQVHVCPRTLDVFGPPGISAKLEHKLKSYDWNLAEAHYCRFRVTEVHRGRLLRFLLPGAEGFTCRFLSQEPRQDGLIHSDAFLRVEARLCDHLIPSLAFRLTERKSFAIDAAKLREQGLVPGGWLEALKDQFWKGRMGKEPLRVQAEAGLLRVEDTARLFEAIRLERPCASLGYATDLGFTPENIRILEELMRGVDLLLCECTFLVQDRAKARKSYHLCTEDLNELAAHLAPRALLPMHLSKSYLNCAGRIYSELRLPRGTRLIRIAERITPRPLLLQEIRKLE